MHLNTVLTESLEDIIMTGMFLQLSSSMIEVSSEKPDIDGNSTSVNTRSIPDDLFFNVSHAFKPSRTAATL
jgi:hypothetical protein